jgi:hypothetical protein
MQLVRHEAAGRATMGDVSEYIVNPRRAPRAPSRCAALVHTPDAAWSAETEDIGPMGCQLVAPGAMARGLPLKLVFANPKVQGSLQVEGKVAWGSSRSPWRVGVAFGDASRAQAERWIAQLVAAHPGLTGFRRVPDRLPVDAMIFLAPPPTFLVDFTSEEVEVLRHVASGTTVNSLRRRLSSNWSAAQRAVFSLLARGAVTVSGSAAVHPSAWKKVMADLEVDFVLEVARSTRPEPVIERRAPKGPSLPDGPIDMELDPRFTPAPGPGLMTVPGAPAASPGRTPAPIPTPGPMAAIQPTPAPGSPTAGTGWRGDVRLRSREAQECFDIGRAELVAGRGNSAMAHLRRALQLAPGDAEIAATIGRAMASG